MDSWRHLLTHLLELDTTPLLETPESESPPPAAMATKHHHLLLAAAVVLGIFLLLPSGCTATAVEYCSKRASECRGIGRAKLL